MSEDKLFDRKAVKVAPGVKEKVLFTEQGVNIPGMVGRYTVDAQVVEQTSSDGRVGEFVLVSKHDDREDYFAFGFDNEIVGVQLMSADIEKRTFDDFGLRFPRASAIVLLEATLAKLKASTN